MSRVLVTGATGFVGPALVETLTAAGHRVRVALRRDVAPLPGVEYTMTGSVGPGTDWRPALIGVSAVVHLAARAHVMRREPDALTRFRAVNAEGTRHLAEAAARTGVRRFVLLSSVKAMAEASPPGRALTEADLPAPQDAYGVSKREGEMALMEVAEHSRIEPVIVRAPLVYGPGVKGNFLRLMRLVDRGAPLPFGAVANRRSLIARANLVGALCAALEHPAAPGRTFLVADDETLSTPELIRRLAHALGRRPLLLSPPPGMLRWLAGAIGRQGDIDRLTGNLEVDAAAIRDQLGWRPAMSVDQALAETAAWYRTSRP